MANDLDDIFSNALGSTGGGSSPASSSGDELCKQAEAKEAQGSYEEAFDLYCQASDQYSVESDIVKALEKGIALIAKLKETSPEKAEEKFAYIIAKLQPSSSEPQEPQSSSSSSEDMDALSDEGFQAYKAGNYAKAIEIWHKTAANGNDIDCKNLGICYRDGIGVNTDLAKSEEWFKKAIANGNEAAKELLSDLKSKRNNSGGSSSSSTSTSSSRSGGKGSIIFGIIGAVVCGLIGSTIISFLGIGFIGGAIGGFFLGKWLGGKIFGKILILALFIGGGLYFGRSYITPLIASVTGKANLQTAAAQTVTATVNANVNFRTEPTTGDNLIRQLQQGDTVTLTGEVSGGWTQILHNGDKGWISTEYLKK